MKVYFITQLTILIMVDLYFVLLLNTNSKDEIIFADFILGLVQFFPTIILAIVKFKKHPILFAYLLFSILVLFSASYFQSPKTLQMVYFYFCFIVAHGYVYLLYKLQKPVQIKKWIDIG